MRKIDAGAQKREKEKKKLKPVVSRTLCLLESFYSLTRWNPPFLFHIPALEWQILLGSIWLGRK